MPCHNCERFIREAINSVLTQSYKDWELLIIDDNSVDKSIEIINYFLNKDKRIRFFQTSKSTGYPATPRNIGIKNATGRFIAFLDSDDQWLPSKLERQVPLFSNDKVAVVFSNYLKIDSNGKEIGCVENSNNGNYQLLLKGNFIGNLTGIYDISKVGKIYQKEIKHEDYLMWLTILRNDYKAINTNTLEAKYRVHKESVSTNKFALLTWQWKIYRNQLNLSMLRCMYYYFCYALNAIKKYR